MRLKLLSIVAIFPSLVLSQGTSRGVGSLKLPSTPFVAATGSAFIADPTGIQSMRINPANISSRESYGVSFSHTEWFQDVRTEYLAIAAPFRFGNLSFSIGNTSVDDIPIRDLPGPALGSFNSQSTFFQLTYAIKVTEDVSIGIAPKYLYEKIFVDDATGWGVDIGTLYTPPIDGLVLGFALTDLGSLAAFRHDRTDFPSQARIGATYSFSVNEISFRTATAFASEFGVSVNHASFGCEAIYDPVSVRIGYTTGYEYRGFSAGLGLQYSMVNIDYAFLPSSSQMGNSNIISISFIL
jgi:hypothetical protein